MFLAMSANQVIERLVRSDQVIQVAEQIFKVLREENAVVNNGLPEYLRRWHIDTQLRSIKNILWLGYKISRLSMSLKVERVKNHNLG